MAELPTDGLSMETKARFLELQRRFASGLPGRWLEIRDADDGRSLESALHRLAGSAASFGFERIGRLAQEAQALALDGSSAALMQALAALEGEIRVVQG